MPIVAGVITPPDYGSLSVNGVPLQTLAFNVTQRGSRWKVPGRRGDNQALPGLHGSHRVAGKPYDENTIVLGMWIVGANEDGTLPTVKSRQVLVEQHLDMLVRLFTADAGVSLQQHRLDGDRYMAGEVTQAVDFTSMAGATRAEFNVEIVAADPFWYDEATTTQVQIVSEPQTVRLDKFSEATGPLTKGVYKVVGPVQSPTLTNPMTGQWVKLATELTAGQTWVLDSGQWSSTIDGANALSDTVHGLGATFIDLSALGGGPKIRLDGDGMSGQTSLSVTARKAYLLA